MPNNSLWKCIAHISVYSAFKELYIELWCIRFNRTTYCTGKCLGLNLGPLAYKPSTLGSQLRG